MFERPYSESDWTRDADFRERSGVKFDSMQLREVEIASPSRCCLDSASFTAFPSLQQDPDTGYLEGTYYQCNQCGSRISEYDFAALVQYEDEKAAAAQQTEKPRREAA